MRQNRVKVIYVNSQRPTHWLANLIFAIMIVGGIVAYWFKHL